jgi:hypothetical protein
MEIERILNPNELCINIGIERTAISCMGGCLFPGRVVVDSNSLDDPQPSYPIGSPAILGWDDASRSPQESVRPSVR